MLGGNLMDKDTESKNTDEGNERELERKRLDLEIKRFEFERDKRERELRLENKRFSLERRRSQFEQRFVNKNLGVLISAAISLAAVLVSIGQVWVAKISKDKELQVASFQKVAEDERLDKQKDKELTSQDAERERQWNLSRAKFITENKKTLFDGSAPELKRMSLIIETLFPHDIANDMFEDFKRTADSPQNEKIWSNAQERLQRRANILPAPSTATSSQPNKQGALAIQIFDENRKLLGANSVMYTLRQGDRIMASGRLSGNSIRLEAPPGTYRLKVDAQGYLGQTSSVTVLEGVTSLVNVVLHKLDSPQS
jgi:hypothetical protein